MHGELCLPVPVTRCWWTNLSDTASPQHCMTVQLWSLWLFNISSKFKNNIRVYFPPSAIPAYLAYQEVTLCQSVGQPQKRPQSLHSSVKCWHQNLCSDLVCPFTKVALKRRVVLDMLVPLTPKLQPVNWWWKCLMLYTCVLWFCRGLDHSKTCSVDTVSHVWVQYDSQFK